MIKNTHLWWKAFWVIFAITMAVYMTMVAWSLPKLAEMAGGQPAFDLRPFGYSFDEAKSFLEALGTEGRDFYLTVQQRLDTAYPALIAITMVLALIGLDRGGWGYIICVFSIAGTIFDYLENFRVRDMLETGHENLTPEMVEQASSWTFLKSISHTIAFTGLLILILVAVFGWFKARRAKSADAQREENTEQVSDE